MNRKDHQLKQQRDEAGFAAILVTLIVIGVVTLMTIGFIQVVSREGRDALDRQLSTQAFYAAETAVNDAQKLISDGEITDAKESCDVPEPMWNPVLSHVSDAADDSIAYTCVLVDFDLDSLFYQNIATEHARPIYLSGVSSDGTGTNLNEITLLWNSPDSGSTDLGASGIAFPVPGGSSNLGPDGLAPVLRVSITPITGLSRQALVQNTFTTFLRPTQSGASMTTNYTTGNPAAQGSIQQVPCTSGNLCDFTITGLNFQNALLVVRAVYGPADLTVQSANGVLLRGEQVLVDATGRASDVLRRIQVRLPAANRPPAASFAIEAATGICKDYLVGGGPPSTDCQL